MNEKWLALDFGIFGVLLLLFGFKVAIIYAVFTFILHWRFDKN